LLVGLEQSLEGGKSRLLGTWRRRRRTVSLWRPGISGKLRTGTLEIFVVFVAIGDVVATVISGVVATKVGIERILVLGKAHESKVEVFPVSVLPERRIERGSGRFRVADKEIVHRRVLDEEDENGGEQECHQASRDERTIAAEGRGEIGRGPRGEAGMGRCTLWYVNLHRCITDGKI
jgi:hypothetical protein